MALHPDHSPCPRERLASLLLSTNVSRRLRGWQEGLHPAAWSQRELRMHTLTSVTLTGDPGLLPLPTSQTAWQAVDTGSLLLCAGVQVPLPMQTQSSE